MSRNFDINKTLRQGQQIWNQTKGLRSSAAQLWNQSRGFRQNLSQFANQPRPTGALPQPVQPLQPIQPPPQVAQTAGAKRCKGKTAKGLRCRHTVKGRKVYCGHHSKKVGGYNPNHKMFSAPQKTEIGKNITPGWMKNLGTRRAKMTPIPQYVPIHRQYTTGTGKSAIHYKTPVKTGFKFLHTMKGGRIHRRK